MGSQYTSPLVETEETRVHNTCLLSSRDRKRLLRRDRADVCAKDVFPFVKTEEIVDSVFWYTIHVHYTLVWICLWN
jgi:hypothetical protein